MTEFYLGLVAGATLACCGFVLFASRRGADREPQVWTEEHYQAPPVTTRIINKHRSIDI